MFLKKVNYAPDERFPADDNNESVLSLTLSLSSFFSPLALEASKPHYLSPISLY